ncbi:FxSxx-COOH system tetratricopeptide repeat protein [Nonomuraea sp. C10]|uniref:FxSxx-COOH system tetratricopeptide repeat protein n=1 Tax=Nonomuraea sp. C10 TaxID=2600577 RepID=UPI0021C2924F|nr:FxSxx-COOH system tetratricopeptide repeat protein [Nonomuraea sp. C10]
MTGAGDHPEVWKVPPRNKNFTGREELLNRLRSDIAGKVTAVVPHALYGLAGVGKTQAAVEYAHRFRQHYDLVWWVPADQPGLVRTTLAQLAPRLGLPEPSAMGIEEAAAAVLDALRRGVPYSAWLLIFDNADEPADFTDVIPSEGPGHVLVTSRNHRWENVVDTVAIDVFQREESVQFFKRRMRRAITDEDATRLADALGDLPLALEQAAALQTETGMPTDEYLRLLEERTSRLLSEGKPIEYRHSMTAAWELSMAQLKKQSPEAMELLRCCAFFGPEPIPRAVFAPVEGPVRAQTAELVADPIRLGRAIGKLNKYALVRIDNESRLRTLQVHRLIQALVREELRPEEHQSIRSEVHSLLVGWAPSDLDVPAAWARYDALLPHIAPAKVAESLRPGVRDFALNVVNYLSASGNHVSMREHVRVFREQWTRDSGPEDVYVLKATKAEGDLLRYLGKYNEAFELNTRTLASLRQAVGNENPETLALLNGIGADLRAKGLFREAREHDTNSVNLHKKVLGPGHVRTLRAMNNLAIDHGLLSDYWKAREILEEALRTQQGERQDQTGTVLNLWNSLSRAVRGCGEYEEACDIGHDALAYGQEQLDADHYRILLAKKDLAISLLRAGDRAEALEMAREVHARYVRLYGLEHPGTLAAAACLSNSLRVNDEAEKAFKLAVDTMERFPKLYGAEHPYTCGCVSNVALLHRVRGRPEEARRLNQQALEGIEKRLGRDHHYSLIIAINLASDLAELGDLEAACRLGEDNHLRLTALLGERHPTTLAAASNLSADLRASGREEEAEILFERTMEHYAATLGREHADVKVAANQRHLDLDIDPPPI